MANYVFNAKETTEKLINWIHDWFEKNGNGCNAVIGLSGGKDSTIVAALCVAAIGKDRVIGVAMPDGMQSLNDADKIANTLGIKFLVAPITEITSAMKRMFAMKNTEGKWDFAMSKQAEQNIPPRARMIMLRAIAQSNNGRISNNCNLSEDYLGYFTISGDGDGDFAPLANLTVTEIKQIGDFLGLPKEWVHKTPDDGLPSSSPDEAKFGFSYDTLDKYIRGVELPSTEIKEKIDKWHDSILYKLNPTESFPNYVAIIGY